MSTPARSQIKKTLTQLGVTPCGRATDVEFGVLAYVPLSGALPPEDEAHFDGWYSIRELAELQFEYFRAEYPNALVHLVVRLRSEWRHDGGRP